MNEIDYFEKQLASFKIYRTKYGITALTFDVYYNLLSLFYYSLLTVKKDI